MDLESKKVQHAQKINNNYIHKYLLKNISAHTTIT
jgi:hypothetical protein